MQLEDILNLPIIKNIVKNAIDNGLDRLSKSIDLSDKVRNALGAISNPLSIDVIDNKRLRKAIPLHLVTKIHKVNLAPVTGDIKNLHTTLFVEANLALVVSNHAPEIEPPPLPQIKVGTEDSSIHIQLATRIDYTEARELVLAKVHRDKNMPIVIEDIELYGSNDKLVLALKIIEPARGILYLLGTPSYDLKQKSITVVDLDYSAETRNVIVDLIDTFAHQYVVNTLRKAAVFPIEKHTNTMIQGFRERTLVFSDEVELRVKTENITFDDVWVSPDGILVALTLEGSAQGHYRKAANE